MKVKEIKRIDCDKLRNMCVSNRWYTRGSSADYNQMFEMCKKDNITTASLFKIAKNIYEHTNVENAVYGCSPEYGDNENILNMMIYVNDCTYVFYQIS